MMYAVKAKCGHSGFGRNYYIPIIFAVFAPTASGAAQKVRWFPRVKHDHKDAILDVWQIDILSYKIIENTNSKDLFLQARSIQEQRLNISYEEIICRIQKECVFENDDESIVEERFVYFNKKERLRNPHKCNRYIFSEEIKISRVGNF